MCASPPLALLRLALEAVLKQELSDHYTSHARSTPVAHRYAGVGVAKDGR